jgi:hypothetical protein
MLKPNSKWIWIGFCWESIFYTENFLRIISPRRIWLQILDGIEIQSFIIYAWKLRIKYLWNNLKDDLRDIAFKSM